MRRSKLMTWLMALLMSTSALGVSTCPQVLELCNKAVEAQTAQVQIRDKEIGQAEAMLAVQSKENSDLKREADAWYNSKILWFVLGAGITSYFIKK